MKFLSVPVMFKRPLLFVWSLGISLAVSSPSQTVLNSSFESPHIENESIYHRWVFLPRHSHWTFQGHSGIAANGSDITYAPDHLFTTNDTDAWKWFGSERWIPTIRLTTNGSQVAFLDSTELFGSSVEQAVFGFQSNRVYELSVLACAKNPGRPTLLHIYVDQQELRSAPPSTNWSRITCPRLEVSAGTHTIKFSVDQRQTGQTMLIDDVQLNSVEWSK